MPQFRPDEAVEINANPALLKLFVTNFDEPPAAFIQAVSPEIREHVSPDEYFYFHGDVQHHIFQLEKSYEGTLSMVEYPSTPRSRHIALAEPYEPNERPTPKERVGRKIRKALESTETVQKIEREWGPVKRLIWGSDSESE
jgi:hypothetical protein